MKKIIAFLTLAALALALCACGAEAVDEPFTLRCAASYLYWDECEGAVEYSVLLDGQCVDTVTECAYSASEEFEVAQVIATKEDGKEQKSTKAYYDKTSHGGTLIIKTEDELSSASLSSCASLTLDLTEGLSLKDKSVTIPKSVRLLNIISDGSVSYSNLKITVETRTADLTVSLKNFSATGKTSQSLIEMRSAEGYDPTLVIKCEGSCSLSGGNGKNGADGDDGAMLQHGANGGAGGGGASAVKAERVLIVGTGRIAFSGGNGGSGGKGGLGNGINNPGNGGNGGNGGYAIDSSEITLYMNKGASCYMLGGAGGIGGDGGDKYSTSFGSSSRGIDGSPSNEAPVEIRKIRGILK